MDLLEFNEELVDSIVQIYKDRLKKNVEELLDNAFKYSPAGIMVRVVGAPVEQIFVLVVLPR